MSRFTEEFVVTFASAATVSNAIDISGFAFGSLIVPVGSPLVGKTLQVQAVSKRARFVDVDLLTTPKNIVAGSNAFTADELTQMGWASIVKLKVNSAVVAEATACLAMKS